MRYWDGKGWTEQFGPQAGPTPVQLVNPPTNHILHLLLSIVTAGLWIPVWIIISITNRNRADRNLPPIEIKASLLRAGIALAIIVAIFIIVRLSS
jgi:hypothetical protein